MQPPPARAGFLHFMPVRPIRYKQVVFNPLGTHGPKWLQHQYPWCPSIKYIHVCIHIYIYICMYIGPLKGGGKLRYTEGSRIPNCKSPRVLKDQPVFRTPAIPAHPCTILYYFKNQLLLNPLQTSPTSL